MILVVRLVLLVSLILPGVMSAGIIFESPAGAGDLPATAQITAGSGPLDLIVGALADPFGFSDPLQVDLYLIRIYDPLGFEAFTIDDPSLVADPKLFLFDRFGRGVYANDDDPGFGSQSYLSPGHPNGPVKAGFYYLGIAWFNNTPLSAFGPIFPATTDTTGPDPVGGAGPLIGWDRNVTQRQDIPGDYLIFLSGATYAVPEPGTFVLLAVPLAFLALRRKNTL